MDSTFFAVNKPKTKKTKSFRKKQSSRDKYDEIFYKLSKNLEDCLDKKVVEFYEPILHKIRRLLDKSSGSKRSDDSDEVPSLFVQGNCVSWESVFKSIKKLKECENTYLCCIDSSETSLKRLTKGVNVAKEKKQNLLVFVLQVECFARNSLIDNIIEYLVNCNLRCYLVMSTVIDFSMILDRISRMNFTYLDVYTLELSPPGALLNEFYDALLDGSALHDSRLQFAGELLSRARWRYLLEDFSLSELRKYFNFALANYFMECGNTILKADDSKNFIQRKTYIKVLNGLVMLRNKQIDGCIDTVQTFLDLHTKIQSEDGFVVRYLSDLRLNFCDWSKETWLSILKQIDTELEKSTETAAERSELVGLCEMLQRKADFETEKSPLQITTNIERISRSKHSAASFLASKGKILKAVRNMPAAEEMDLIITFLAKLFKKFLLKYDRKFNIDLPNDKLVYLETSNVKHLDEIMNERIEHEPTSQLDFVKLYHVLVDSNSETVAIDLTDAFDKFTASIACIYGKLEAGVSVTCNTSARFFNALAQLEYIGAVVMSSEKTIRLVYLPTPAFQYTDEITDTEVLY